MSEYQANIVTRTPATPGGPSPLGAAPGVWRLNDVAAFIKQGVWPDANVDPYWAYTSLLLSTTSLNNANNNLFVDSSGAFNPVSRGGSVATLQGSFTPYAANWSNYFDGSGDSLSLASSSAFALGSSDFTIEYWVYYSSLSTNQTALDFRTGSPSNNAFSFYQSSTGGDGKLYIATATTTRLISNAAMSANTWTHIAVVRSSGVSRLYINGTAQTQTWSDTTDWSTNQPLRIGSDYNSTNPVNGYISNLRIVKGTAVYTANFTPPTTNLTAISGTSLLTCQSNRFRDASTNNFTLTVNGNTAVQEFNPFILYPSPITYNQSDITNWSGYFDGSGDYLTLPTNSSLNIGSATTWTVEFWGFVGAAFGTYCPISMTQDTNVRWDIEISAGSTQVLFDNNTGATFTHPSTLSPNNWFHFALVRDGTTMKLYINGVASSTTSTGNVSSVSTSTLTYIGRNNFSGFNFDWNGYISNLRVVKGTAVYTANFTPPTTNLTAISGTSLLTLQNAAFTDNSTNNFVITPNGNVTVTGNSPFNTVGYWSNYFDGSGDYLSAASNTAFDCSTGNWTIEGWVNITTRTTNYPLFFGNNRGGFTTDALALTVSNSDNASYNDKFVFAWGSAGFSSPSAGSAALLVSNVTNDKNTWYHFAVVRNGTSIKMYRNGVEVASATISSGATFNWGFNGVLVGGGNWDGANSYINGYISNLRLVKGTAVYTAAFTPPSAPLTAISGTSLLTCQNGRFIDNSTNNFTITVNGNTSIQSFDPFYTSTVASNGGSMYFSSTSTVSLETILNVPASNNLDIGAGDFTVECWVYLTATQNYSRIIQFNNTWASAGATPLINANTDTQKLTVSSYDFGVALITADNPYVFNTWYHVAVTRSGNVFSMYINGVKQSGTYTTSSRLWATTTPFMSIGNGPTSVGGFSPMQGYVSDVRIIKGAAIYTASFTPPTAPLTPTPSTVLLVNGMNAGIYDATTSNDMETAGNAQVRFPTPFAPANYYAGAFDGSGDYISVPSNAALALGSGNFTMEMWVFSGANGTSTRLGGNGTGGSWAANRWVIATSTPSNPNKFTFALNNASPVDLLVSTSTFNNSQWMHVAIARSGNSWALWVNGTREAYVASNSAAVDGGTSEVLNIGRSNLSGDADWAGIVSNFRLVKGSAVYDPTSTSISVPTTPLTAVSGTSLLTCQNKTFIDNSSNAFTITANGNATAGAIGPFTATGGTSVYFDGNGDYLSMPTGAQFGFGTGDYTVEFWLYLSALPPSGKYTLMDFRTASNAQPHTIYVTSTGYMGFFNGSSDVTSSSQPLSANTWYHIAYSRGSGTLKIFVNGAQAYSAANTVDYQLTRPLTIGAAVGGIEGLNGYIDDFRITKGVARYTATFTPPTAPFPTY